MKNQKLIKKTYMALIGCLKRRIAILLIMAGLFAFKTTPAQVSVTINISSQPLWGPVGYNYVEYYYMPEADVYYYVPRRQFFYLRNGNWFYSTSLPAIYYMDLYRTYKVVLIGPKPYNRHQFYKTKYGKYKTIRCKQAVIRDSRDKKYFVVKGHLGPAKVKAAKPKTVKPAGVKPKSSKSTIAKPKKSSTGNAKPKGSNPGKAKPKNSKGNSSKGSSSGAKGKKNK